MRKVRNVRKREEEFRDKKRKEKIYIKKRASKK